MSSVKNNDQILPPAAANVLIDDALRLAAAPDAASRAAFQAIAHAKRIFEVGGGTRVVQEIVIADVLLNGVYDARTRETCMRVLSSLELPSRVLLDAEREISFSLSEQVASVRNLEGRDRNSKDDGTRRTRARWLKIGGATVIGGVALGISGGLLAPALIPALGSLGLAGAATVTGSGATIAVGSLFGVAGAGFGANAMANRTSDVKEFVFERCACCYVGPNSLDDDSSEYSSRSSVGIQGSGVITPENRILQVSVEVKPSVTASAQPSSGLIGGMLVWEFTTSQPIPMVVPAGIRFGVIFRQQGTLPLDTSSLRRRKSRKSERNWVYPEEELDAGGTDKYGKGSLSVDIQYRYALVPPGVDPPVFIMKGNGEDDVSTVNGLSVIDRPRSLSIAIFVPGLLLQGSNPESPGVIVDQFAIPNGAVSALQTYDIESYGLRWETKQLASLSQVLDNVVQRFAVRVAAQEGARIIAPALVGALALPVSLVMAMRTVIDNVWATTLSRARSAAFLFAASLPEFGHRPITLAGYSAGAAVIFGALEELARDSRIGLIHDVYLIGAPVPCDRKRWENIRNVVSGRIVNGFWPGDWFLEVAQRSTSFNTDLLTGIAGTSPVSLTGVSVEDVDITSVCKQLGIGNHANFAASATQIFRILGLGSGEQRRHWPFKVTNGYVSTSGESSPSCADAQVWPNEDSSMSVHGNNCQEEEIRQNLFGNSVANAATPTFGRSLSEQPRLSTAQIELDDVREVVVFNSRGRRNARSESPAKS